MFMLLDLFNRSPYISSSWEWTWIVLDIL